VAILPARPYTPKDKAKVENGVLIAKRLIIGRLRNRIFTSLADLNQAILELVELLNDKPLTTLKVSRRDLFESLDQPNALPLPEDTFEFAQWKKVRVGINYHVLFDKHSYSVPYTLIHEELEIRATVSTIEIYKKGQRLLSHKRSYKIHGYTTQKEHMPPSHQKYLEWTPERIIEWAKKYGSFVETLVNTILFEREHPEQAYRACLGIIRLGSHYSPERLNRACQRAIAYHNHTYRAVRTILEKNLDQIEMSTNQGPANALLHENVRGSEYYGNSAVLHV
jgi:transposase